jgi:hypothetical protein
MRAGAWPGLNWVARMASAFWPRTMRPLRSLRMNSALLRMARLVAFWCTLPGARLSSCPTTAVLW